LEDTANVVCSNSDVTFVTPASSPRVLDEEEVFSIEGSIADGEDTVIKFGSASSGDDTGSV